MESLSLLSCLTVNRLSPYQRNGGYGGCLDGGVLDVSICEVYRVATGL